MRVEQHGTEIQELRESGVVEASDVASDVGFHGHGIIIVESIGI